MKSGSKFLPGMLAGLLVGLPLGCLGGRGGSPPAAPTATEGSTNTTAAASGPNPSTSDTAPGSVTGADTHAVQTSAWSYTKLDDEISGKAGALACVDSSDEIHLQPPYGDVRAELCIRRSPRSGVNVFVRLLGDGQYMCTSYEGCRVHVRFDDNPALTLPAREPSDNSSNFVFVESTSKMVAGLSKADRTLFEANFYEAGEQTVHFDTHGLHWPPSAAELK